MSSTGRTSMLGWWGLLASSFLSACGSPAIGRKIPGRYAQTQDSATSACLRNPSCYTAQGQDAILPWVARTADTTRGALAVLQLLDAAAVQRVEKLLVECAKKAESEVNERRLGGRRPTRELCGEEVRKDSRGRSVTRAMELGKEKHDVALRCAQDALASSVPGQFSLEPHYQFERQSGKLRLLAREQVEAWLRDGLLDMLMGTLVPDVVLHASGDPLKIQSVYDFKFPCPGSKDPTWRRFPEGHPYHPASQADIYEEAFGASVSYVAPMYGVGR